MCVCVCVYFIFFFFFSICFFLLVVYRHDDVIHRFVWNIMSLLFLPAHNIQPIFIGTETLVPPNWKMSKLINYVCQPWIEHPVFVPRCWTVCNITVRFNHNRMGTFWHGSVFLYHSFLNNLFYGIRVVKHSFIHSYVLFLASVHRGIYLHIIFNCLVNKNT